MKARVVGKIWLVIFSFVVLLLGIVLSFGTECRNNFLIVAGMFAIMYDVVLELV